MNERSVYIENRPEWWNGNLSVTIKCKPSERMYAEMLSSQIEEWILLHKQRKGPQ